jgi:hypothetical protein
MRKLEGKFFVGLLTLLLLPGWGAAHSDNGELFSRGYSVLPAPQRVHLQGNDLFLDEAWTIDTSRLPAGHMALRSLRQDLHDFYQIDLLPAGPNAGKKIVLQVGLRTVKSEAGAEIDRQAYRLTIASDGIQILGNSDQGLFYGVQTFLQLLKPDWRGKLILPACTIEDWPDHSLRFLHWDTKHHQNRMETIKRYLDWSARFKVNRIGFELEDKFEYPSHPVIGAPGAYTTAELQEIVGYGLERFIEVVPQIQAPAHMAYVLKHEEFKHLRADSSNYQACMCDPEADKLIFSMYEDVIRATPGVDSVFVSTDEVYYAGICNKCTRPYNPQNRSLQWVEFVNKVHDFLSRRNRRMLSWVEFPFRIEHLPMLPKGLINGIMARFNPEVKAQMDHGIYHLAYTSLQGDELLFPNHFRLSSHGGDIPGRLAAAEALISVQSRAAKPLGVFGAAWDDSGLHDETFWLGWATVAQYGWKPGASPVEQTAADFMNIYYGRSAVDLIGIYMDMQRQARFFEETWDRVVSRVRNPGYGSSNRIGPTKRYDRTLPAPALPQLTGLDFQPVYGDSYQERIKQARVMATECERLAYRLSQAMSQVTRNRYGLEVFQSLTWLMRHQCRLVPGLAFLEEKLKSAHAAAGDKDPERAAGYLNEARQHAALLIGERKSVFADLQRVWEKSRYPKGREVNGRKFLHVMDDVKDHWADRRPDLSYLIAPEESIGLEKWSQELSGILRAFREKNKLPSMTSSPDEPIEEP